MCADPTCMGKFFLDERAEAARVANVECKCKSRDEKEMRCWIWSRYNHMGYNHMGYRDLRYVQWERKVRVMKDLSASETENIWAVLMNFASKRTYMLG